MNLFNNTNNVTIEGNLSQVGIKQGQHGLFGSITVAVNNSYKDNSGSWIEKTAFVDVNVNEKTLSSLKSQLNVGDRIEIEGKLITDTWKDKQTGANRSALKVQALRFNRHIEKAAVDCLKNAGFIQQAQPQSGYQQVQAQNQNFQPQAQAQGGFNPMGNQRPQ